MNKITLNKRIQKFVNRAELLDKREVSVAKKLNNGLINFEDLEEKVMAQQQALNLNEIKNTCHKMIEDLDIAEKDQNIQIIRLKQQLKIMEKKLTCFQNFLTGDNIISAADQKNIFNKILRLDLLKQSTGIHIDENTPPNISRGFVIVKTPNFHIKPFEFNLSELSEEACTEKTWNLLKHSSYYQEEWEGLFLDD